MIQTENVAYDKLYLNDVMKVHRYLFFLMEKNTEYSTFSMIDNYMRYSHIRSRIDKGNWSALNKRGKQLYNDIPFERCLKAKHQDEYDDILLGWIADMYVLMQWRYNFTSSFLSVVLPASEMYKAYFPLHETSYDNACEKLYHRYFKDGEVNE